MYQTAYCEESYNRPEGVPIYAKQMAGGVAGGGGVVCRWRASTCVDLPVCIILFNIKCRHSVPADTCPFQPLVGADLYCPP